MHIKLYIAVHYFKEVIMRTVSFTEFRKRASELFSEVENGETLVILRHGKAIAEISPANQNQSKTLSWKKPRLGLSMKGTGLSEAILEERESSR